MELSKEQLEAVDSRYSNNLDDWTYLQAARNGVPGLVGYGILKDIFDEPDQYAARGKTWGLGLATQINQIITDFLGQTPATVDYGKTLTNDESFQAFLADCDLRGTNFPDWMAQQRMSVGFYGSVGIMVDKAQGGNPAKLKEGGIYAYVSAYEPLNITVLTESRDEFTNRPYVSQIILNEFGPDRKIVWDTEEWAIYEKPPGEDSEFEFLRGNANTFGEIPFVNFIGERKSGSPREGKSLVIDTVAFDAEAIRMGIMASRILLKASQPIPVIPAGNIGNDAQRDVGSDKPIQKQPDTSDEKHVNPYWMSPEVESPIKSILMLLEYQEKQVYLSKNLGGILTSTSNQKSSAAAQEMSFRFLNGLLARFMSNEIEAHYNIIRWWLRFQNQEDRFADVNISHDLKFDVKALIATIDDKFTERSMFNGVSITAVRELNKKLSREGSLSDVGVEKQAVIDKEIDEAVEITVEEPDLVPENTGGTE